MKNVSETLWNKRGDAWRKNDIFRWWGSKSFPVCAPFKSKAAASFRKLSTPFSSWTPWHLLSLRTLWHICSQLLSRPDYILWFHYFICCIHVSHEVRFINFIHFIHLVHFVHCRFRPFISSWILQQKYQACFFQTIGGSLVMLTFGAASVSQHLTHG